MTSHELAQKLLAMENLPVTIPGYEGGVNVVRDVTEPKAIHLNVHDEWYYGKHEYHVNLCNVCDEEEAPKDRAIHIG